MHLILWGTYVLGTPRTRILREGLRSAGVELTEIHAGIRKGQEDKSQIAALAWAGFLARVVIAYPQPILRSLRAPDHDAVLAPYLGQNEAIGLWPFARLRRRRVVLDLFLSLYDTVTLDRRMARPGSLVGRLLRATE